MPLTTKNFFVNCLELKYKQPFFKNILQWDYYIQKFVSIFFPSFLFFVFFIVPIPVTVDMVVKAFTLRIFEI